MKICVYMFGLYPPFGEAHHISYECKEVDANYQPMNPKSYVEMDTMSDDTYTEEEKIIDINRPDLIDASSKNALLQQLTLHLRASWSKKTPDKDILVNIANALKLNQNSLEDTIVHKKAQNQNSFFFDRDKVAPSINEKSTKKDYTFGQ